MNFALRTRYAAALTLLALSACGSDPASAQATNSDAIVASSWPVAFLAERVAGSDYQVSCPVPPGADPLQWTPDRQAITTMNAAGLIVLNGAEFEPWAERASLPLSRVVHTADVFQGDWIVNEVKTHSHGPRGDHSHGAVDPHTWLDPLHAKAQAGAIRDALGAANQDAAAGFEERFAELAAELDALNEQWSSVSPALNGRRLLASHAAYDYLAKRYGWTIVNFDLDPEQMPAEAELESLRSAAQSEPPAVALLWESAPTEAIANAAFKATGLPNVVVSPAEVRSAEATAAGMTYLDVQRANVQSLLDVCQKEDQ